MAYCDHIVPSFILRVKIHMYSRVSDTWVLVLLCVFQEFEDLSKQETVHMYEDFLDSCVIEPCSV